MGRPKKIRKPRVSQKKIEQPEVVADIKTEAEPQARSRTDEQRGERRRRDTEMDGYRYRLSIPPQYQKDKEHNYRWINDDKSRVFDLTKEDDWDQVQAEGQDGASTVRRQVGTKQNGEPLFAHLVRKPKEFCAEDEAKKQAALDETFEQLAAGKRGDPVSLGGGQTGYVATDTTIRDGRRT